ncbi:ERC protein 2 [Oryzias melastigma]|uniref:ERC protein 2 n=1 Tax=Oryzias melastigma TaxID=30732 RepID=A0A834BTM7_ORYME|nr:ERC protein 2 [Oryzias melastigma]
MKDMLDVKERKVNVLQKKIENLLEQLKDKDKQLAGLRERVQGLQTDSNNTDTALATLEEALSGKGTRVIENLREQKEREDRTRTEELEQMRRENQILKDKLSVQQPLKLSQSPANNPSCNPRPEAGWRGHCLWEPLTLNDLNTMKNNTLIYCPCYYLLFGSHHCHMHKIQNMEDAVRIGPDISDRLRLLEQEVARYREESSKSQAEVERLMGALRDAETEKSSKEKKISDLERQIKSPNIQKQMIPGEMRKDVLVDGHPHSLSQPLLFASQGAMRDTAERIMELEKALRESMNTAAHREALWAQEEAERVQAQRQVLHGVSHAHRGPKTSKHTHTDTFHLKNQGSREDVKN